MSVIESIQEVFRDVFDDNTLLITNGTTAEDIENWDSLNHINLMMAIENEFKIKFALGELESMKKVGDMLDTIEKKLA